MLGKYVIVVLKRDVGAQVLEGKLLGDDALKTFFDICHRSQTM